MANRREQCKQIAELDYIKCTWNAEWDEFRVTLDGLSAGREEAMAYYTNDFDDALLTARVMSKERSEQLRRAVGR